MNVGRTRLLLKFAAAALACAGAFAVAFAVLSPLAEPSDSPAGQQPPPSLLANANSDDVPLASLAPAWSRNLQRPLTETPGVASQPQPAAVALPVRLVGTILDPAKPRGIFVTIRGQMELRGAGEKAGGVDVLSVDEHGATISVAGNPVALKIEKLEAPVPAALGASEPAPASTANSDATAGGSGIR